MEKYYRFAGIELAVRIPEERMYRDELRLEPFRTDRVRDPHIYQVSAVKTLPAPEGAELAIQPGVRCYASEGGYTRYQGAVQEDHSGAHILTRHRGKYHEILVREDMLSEKISARLVLNGLDVEHLVASEGGAILHASCIGYEGRAIVFTAPSETGKSTQAELWKSRRGAEIINGDRAVLIREQGVICAAGLPFSGSSRYCANRTLPLMAVVYLKQAPETTIRKLRGAEAFRRLWEGLSVHTWHRTDMEKTADLAEKLLGQVPVYELACTPDETAVEALEAQLRKQVSL